MAWQWIGRCLVALFYAAPWAWLMCFAVFVAAVTYETGHFPSYSNPDPKNVDSLSILYMLVVTWLGLALLSPFVVVMHTAVHAALYPAWPLGRARLAVYALGAAFVAYIILGDPAGLRTWLFD